MSLTNQSYQKIRDSLLTEDSIFEQRLSINRLSRELGIGRSPVRDAVTRLAAEGLLQPVAKSGVVVRQIGYEELRDIVGLREALEPYAAGRASDRMEYNLKKRLRSLFIEFRRLARQVRDQHFRNLKINRQMQKADWRFHNLILETADNRTLHKIVEDYHLLLRKVRYPSIPDTRHLALTVQEHWRICQALENGDSAAARHWMLRHARRGGEAMLQSWREVNDG